MTEANVTGYTVIYGRVSGSRKRQDGEMRSVFPATATSGVIDGLESEATYVFLVLASAVVEGKEVVGDRSLLTKDSLLITRGIFIIIIIITIIIIIIIIMIFYYSRISLI